MKINKLIRLTLISVSIITLNLYPAATMEEVREELTQKKMNQEFLYAVKNGEFSDVKKFLEMEVNLNFADKLGITPLIAASEKGYYDIAKLLINVGAPIDSGTLEGNTALMLAASFNKQNIIASLINNGANVNLSNQYGATALLLAVREAHKEVVQLLLDAGANIDYADECKEKSELISTLHYCENIEQEKKELRENHESGLKQLGISRVVCDAGKCMVISTTDDLNLFYQEIYARYKEILRLIKAEPSRRQAALERRKQIIAKLNETVLPPVLVDIIDSYLPVALTEYIESMPKKEIISAPY